MASVEASAEQPVALAIDIGTSSVRALLFDRRGDAVAGSETQIAYDLTTTPDGGAFVPAATLTELTGACVDGAHAFAKSAGLAVGAVGISCFWHSLLGVDGAGAPTTSVLLWADTRSGDEAIRLRTELDQAAVHDRTGCVLHSSYWPAKLRWLTRVEPATVRRTVRWCAYADFLLRELTGVDVTSISMASGTGMLDVRRGVWDGEMTAVAGIDPATLPPIAGREPVRGLRPEPASRWPLLAGVPWLPGVGDGACANVGTGAISAGRIALSLGTSGAMRIAVDYRSGEPLIVPRELWAYRLDHDHAVLGAAISNGGKVVAWLNELLETDFDGEEMRRAAMLAPDAHGLTFLPFLAGERSPIWNDHATAVIAGLTLSTGRAELLRCGMEAVALRFARLYAGLRAVAAPEHEIVANGAALLKSEAWLRITADTLGHPIVALPPEAEASARGAAVLALAAARLIAGIGDVRDPAAGATRVPPVAEHQPVYRRALARQTRLEQLLYPAGSSWDRDGE